MSNLKENKKLAKLVAYMLAQAPSEFGLVPDASGYVKIKELIKALNEEEGWRHVRAAMLNELVLTLDDVPFEMNGDTVRAKQRGAVDPAAAPALPKLLYTCIRQRAYGRVSQAGISPSFADAVVLSSDRDMAERIGKRRDPEPVILVVETQVARNSGVVFRKSDGDLYLADFIPPGCFTGPPVPPPRPTRPRPEPVKAPLPGTQALAGTFFLEPKAPDTAQKHKSLKGRKKEIDWKKDRRHGRIKKERGWP